MIDFDSGVPRHRQLADSLRSRIRAGEWAAGAKIPRESDLAHEYEVGVATVRRALVTLLGEGLLLRGGPGQRHQVPPAVELEPVWPRRGSIISARMPTPNERRELGIPEGVPVLVVRYHMERPQIYRGDRYELRTE